MTPQMDKSLKVRQNAIPRTATAGELLAVKNEQITNAHVIIKLQKRKVACNDKAYQ